MAKLYKAARVKKLAFVAASADESVATHANPSHFRSGAVALRRSTWAGKSIQVEQARR